MQLSSQAEAIMREWRAPICHRSTLTSLSELGRRGRSGSEPIIGEKVEINLKTKRQTKEATPAKRTLLCHWPKMHFCRAENLNI